MQIRDLFFLLLAIFLFHPLRAQAPDYGNLRMVKQVYATPVKDQFYTSTCWSFAGTSFIESEYFRMYGKTIDLSEMFFARYSYINKVRAYLQHQGNIYFTPGGQFHDILQVIREQGIVPQEDFILPDGSDLMMDHRNLDTMMALFTGHLLEEGKTSPAETDLKFIDRLLDRDMGKVMTDFEYGGKIYTPQTFTKEVLKFNPDDYIEITSYTHHPFYTGFVLEDKYNWMKKEYMNVPLSDFLEITRYAIDHDFTVCWDGDVTEKGFDYYKGAAYLEKGTTADQKSRQSTFEDQTTTIDHLMHITGYAKDKKNANWYYVKNSWGGGNPQEGYLYMSEDYFKLKTVAIIVHKDAIPQKIKDKMKI